jgi:hypothetical protein
MVEPESTNGEIAKPLSLDVEHSWVNTALLKLSSIDPPPLKLPFSHLTNTLLNSRQAIAV